MHIVNCAKAGSDVMTGPLSFCYQRIIKHTVTDIGLNQFIEDAKNKIIMFLIPVL